MTVINRRTFIASTIAATSAAAIFGRSIYSNSLISDNAFFLSAFDDKKGNHFIGGWSLTGESNFVIPVPHRAHDSCCSPDKTLGIFFARRPGTQMYIVDLKNGHMLFRTDAKIGYHFYGHGVFSNDGRYLFTTQNNYQAKDPNNSGVISVYDIQDVNEKGVKQIGQYQSGGIGPHQLALLSDGHTLVIANGGIFTHPNSDRKKLNLTTMKPSLTYIDSRSGIILDQFYPAHHQMSIRHLAITSEDQVVMGVQYQGNKHDQIPMVLSHKREQELHPMNIENSLWRKQNHYIASVAVDNTGGYAISTSPRGNNVSLWSLSTLECLDDLFVRDVAGATYSPDSNCFLISNGLGQLSTLSIKDNAFITQPMFLNQAIHWDNHLSQVS